MTARRTEQPDEPIEFEDLIDQLEELEATVDAPEERAQVRETMRVARRVTMPRMFGRVVADFGPRDAAEAFLGSVIFGIPMLVEDGTLDIGAYIAPRPPFLALTILLGVSLTIVILYVAELQHVQLDEPYFGILPRRLLGVLGVSFTTAVALMTVWGRVSWETPQIAFAQVSVTFVAMSIGAALGDILPGS